MVDTNEAPMVGEGTLVDGKYTILKKVSEGGGGAVWLAKDLHGSEVALKILKWSPLKTKELASERFKNEFAIFKTLSHPNIARIYDFGVDPTHDMFYFTSELITGGDLKSFKERPIDEIEPLFLQALRSLEYLRNSGLLHLDIKPQNFLLRTENGRTHLVLIDFGLATFRPPDKPGGTPNYMPPEIAIRRLPEGAPHMTFPPPDHRSDLYSLGVTFYYILTGVQPFLVKNAETGRLDVNATMLKHIHPAEIAPPSHYRPDIPGYLDTIIMKLMARHPDDRYPAAAIAAQALRYRSPQELEPENLESLLSYLPKEGKMIGRSGEIEAAEAAVAAIARHTPHAKPILLIAGGRGVGRSRLLSHLKPFAQRLETDVHLINAQRASADELARLSIADTDKPRAHVLLIDNLDIALADDADAPNNTALLEPLREFIMRARRTQRISKPTSPPTLIACAVDIDRMPLTKLKEILDIDDDMLHTISLANFSVDEVRDYLTSLVGEDIPRDAAARLHQISEGNPLVLTEQLERMISEGMLFSFAGRPDAETLEAIGLDFEHLPPPASLKEVTLARYDRLNDAEQKLAQLIACFNQPVTLEDLHHTSDSPDIEAALVRLIAVDLICRIQNNEGHYTFNNPMAAAVIEHHIDEKTCARMHSDIANYLARHAGDRTAIDHHRAHGANKSLKLRALERLAKDAETQRRPHEATEHLEAMFQEIPPSAHDMRADVLIRLGRAYEWAYMPKHAHEAFKRLMTMHAPGEKSRIYKVRALEQLALAAVRRRLLDDAREYILQALHLLGSNTRHCARRIRLENVLAGIDLRDGNPIAAIDHFERTLKLAEKLPDAMRETLTNNELGEALLQANRLDDAERVVTRELTEAQATGDMDRVCSRHYLLGNIFSSPSMARYDDAARHYAQAFDIARGRRLLQLQVRLHNSIGNLHLESGRIAEAIDEYRKGLSLSEQIDSKTTSVELMVGLGLAHARMDDLDTAVEYFEAALDFINGPMGSSAGIIKRYAPTIYVHLGDIYYRKKNADKALTYLEKAEEIDRTQELGNEVRYSIYGTFAEIFAERGDVARAESYLPTLRKIVRHFPLAADHLKTLEKRISSHH